MSKVCEICGKKKMMGNKVSHSHRKSRRSFLPNLQSVKVKGKRMLVCTSCLKKLDKSV